LKPQAVAALGDLQYDAGEAAGFSTSFHRSWGRLRRVLRPAPGNHDYATARAAGYFGYFGRRAGPGRRGYYSYNLGTWHVISLNSNCTVVSCRAGSRQERWLRRDLARHRALCVLAYWHHPLYTSSPRRPTREVAPLWRALERAGAEVVLSGHEHAYERFAPMTASGRVDPRRGIRQFTVGTGGRSLYPVGLPVRGLKVARSAFGVLAISLRPRSYRWRFHALEEWRRFTDVGSSSCR
jgi:hypothetical protein